MSLVDFYRRVRIRHPTLTTTLPYRKVIIKLLAAAAYFL